MTDEQFKRWAQCAIKLAIHCTEGTEKRREKIVAEVKSYFFWRIYQKDWPEIQDWDGNKDTYNLCDQVREFFEEYLHWNPKHEEYEGRFHDQIVCCIQAGFDMAVESEAASVGGVIGYTVGDIKKMFNDTMPDWLLKTLVDSEGKPAEIQSLSNEQFLWL